MAKTSTKAKEKWGKAAYSDLRIRIPKVHRAALGEFCEKNGEAINGYVNRLIRTDMGYSKEEWGLMEWGEKWQKKNQEF